ncbi:putative bifunctional diguanylate cyclase/phosphodiesterase [Falsiroseomonas tokyonensis]|uniref:Bifunctional diguanylate cyclase/phosphodiesterase n=1 Tax=Falsiroseomonas tokyonensis TaxID=430521 RepID=A0ABV7BP51_9PROT|nr:bifunctional diguanylate cyclase/phosphodiesterase [Falsiroseomonas tokyonensis]MBU8536425.1 EAL domain-containing protein [Falsiroseomonas tokyonensis]
MEGPDSGGDPAPPAPSHAGADRDWILDRLTTAVWIYDVDHSRVVWANAAALEVWNAGSLAELAARNLKADMSPAVARRLRQYQTDFLGYDASFTERWTLYPRGVPRRLEVRLSGVKLQDGRMAMFCEARDEARMQPEAIRSADALLHTKLMISLHDLDGRTLYCNPAARASFDSPQQDLPARFLHRRDYLRMMEQIHSLAEVSLIAEVVTATGLRWHELTVRSCHDPVSGRPSILVSETDVTELKEAEALAQSRAHHDPLTGLPNRLAMPARFNAMVRRAEQRGARIGVLFIDLDQFKAINDTLGHLHGDGVLMEVARRLQELRLGEDTVIRLGGDEFLFLAMEGAEEAGRIEILARRILERLAMPVHGERRKLMVTPSVGIACFPHHGTNAQLLMQRADLAMYEAKAGGRNQYRMFDESMRNQREEELQLLSDLREALRCGHILPHYQPRYSPTAQRAIAVEALARWNHPERGLILPSEFIPISEKSGLINQIGATILEQAVRQRCEWARQGLDVSVSINVSQRQLCDLDFAGMVQRVLEDHGCDPKRLELEITETLLIESNPVVSANLAKIRELGIRLAIDDFGTGYSNIARLNEMSVDCIKIDRGLMQGLPRNEEIVRLVIAMCNFMQVTIVAEGIETLEMAEWAQRNGCHELQGYFYSAPVSAEEVECLIQGQVAAAGSGRRRHPATSGRAVVHG